MKLTDRAAWQRVSKDLLSVKVHSHANCVFSINCVFALDAVKDLEEGQSVWGVLDRMDVAEMIEDLINQVLQDRRSAAIKRRIRKSRRGGAA